MLRQIVSAALLSFFMLGCSAQEAEIQKAVESRLGIKVDSVTKAGYFGLYEVYADGNIFYTDEKVTAMLIGGDMIRAPQALNLIDLKTNRNITDERMRKLNAIKFSDLPLEQGNWPIMAASAQQYLPGISQTAKAILADWDAYREKFVKVYPHEYKRALTEMAAAAQKEAA